jgi:hypothetical protein
VGARGPIFAVLAAGLALATAAPALAQNQLYNDYRQDGQVNPCSYSPGQVKKNLRDLPPDVQQYAPGLADQLRRPCGSGATPAPVQQATPAPTPSGGPPAGPGAPKVPAPPAPKAPAIRAINAAAPPIPAGSDSGVPLALAIALGALAGLTLAAVLAGRFAGLDLESLTRPLRASLAEAGGHAGDLRDRLRPRP